MNKKTVKIRKGYLTSIFLSKSYEEDERCRKFFKEKNINFETIIDNVNSLFLALNEKSRILAMGEVQSGKTFLLMCLIQKLFDKNKVDVVIFFTDRTNLIKRQNKDRFIKESGDLFSKVSVVDLKGSKIKNNEINEDEKVIYVALKSSDSFDILSEFKKVYKDKRILIVLDEGDDSNPGEIYNKRLEDYINSNYNNTIKLLYLTATPFRNLLEVNKNKNSIDTFISLNSSPNYEGINSEWNYSSVEFNEMTIEKTDIKNVNMKLIDCFRFYYYQWLLQIEKDNLEQSVFVINIHKLIKIHEKFKKDIRGIYEPESFVETLVNKHKHNLELKPDEIEKLVWKYSEKMNKVNIKVVNSYSDEEEVLDAKYTILIGGTKLSRGYTIKNLHMMFMFNAPDNEIKNDEEKLRNYGVLLQKARWFGYYDGKKRKKELVNVYMMKDDIKKFENLKQIVKWTRRYTLEKGNYLEYLKMNTKGIFNG